MTDPSVPIIRRAIAGDPDAVATLIAEAEAEAAFGPGAVAHGGASIPGLVAAALLASRPELLDGAWVGAVERRDRQLVAIARAWCAGDVDLVDALARDHLVDHPDSEVVAWIASLAATSAASPAEPWGTS